MWFETREDGPNQTQAKKTVKFAGTEDSVTMDTQDELVGGVPSRVARNISVNVGESQIGMAPQYMVKGFEAEFEDMIRSGRQQLVTPVDNLEQSKQFAQIAKDSGLQYSESNGQGSFRPGKGVPGMQLSFKTADAIAAGYSDKEVRAFLSEQGYDEEQANTIFARSSQVVQARQANYSDEEIEQFLTSQETKVQAVETETPAEPDEWLVGQWGAVPKKSTYDRLTSNETMSAEDLVTSLKVLSPNMTSVTTRTVAFFGNQEAEKKVEAAAQASRTRIIDMATKWGLELSFNEDLGKFVANTEAGQVVINESTWSEIMAEKGEIIGGVSGAIGGAKYGSRFGPWGALGGSALGAALGASAGSTMDYLYQAINLQEDIEGHVMAHKALTAAEASVIADVLGFGVIKASGATYRGMVKVKDLVVDGNTKGAYEALKQMEFITDEQAAEMISRLAKVSTNDVPGRVARERAIAATALTKPGAEGLVKAVSAYDPQASRAVSKAINDRARDVLASTAELSGDNFGRIIKEDLVNYVQDVKGFYGEVKAAAAQSPRASNFKFNYDKLALQPVIDTLQKNITDPAVLEKFKLQAEKIRGMSDSRTFGDLLELRQLVNEFKFNKRITNQKDFETLNKVLANIDGAITQGAGVVMENPKAWLESYNLARTDYAKMKQLEKNVMYKALTKPGVSEAEVVKSLSRYITALDGTFNDLMVKLPGDMRGRVENAVIDTLANKYTAGIGEGMRAVNFPLLSKDLNMVSFTTPEARRMKAALNVLGDTFKNDVPLSQIAGNIQIPKFQSYLTADPVVRAKYEIASKTFNYVKTLLPNKEQGVLALVRKTAEVLENPVNAKSVKDLMKEVGDDIDISKDILKLQQEAARAVANGKDVGAPRVKLYGNGSVLGTAKKGAEHSIPVHRIATTAEARTIAEAEGVNFTDNKLLDGILAQYGYSAVQQGTDRVRVINGRAE